MDIDITNIVLRLNKLWEDSDIFFSEDDSHRQCSSCKEIKSNDAFKKLEKNYRGNRIDHMCIKCRDIDDIKSRIRYEIYSVLDDGDYVNKIKKLNEIKHRVSDCVKCRFDGTFPYETFKQKCNGEMESWGVTCGVTRGKICMSQIYANNRWDKYFDKISEKRKKIDKQLDLLLTDDVIKIRYILLQMKRKINNLKFNKNETSK